MAEITHHMNRSTDQTCVGNSTSVVTGSYNIGINRICKIRVEAYIYDTAAPSNMDYGIFEILVSRATGAAVIRRSVTIVPFVLPGTLAGSTVSSALVNGPAGNGNTIQTTFTNPSTGGRSIRVIGDFKLITIQD